MPRVTLEVIPWLTDYLEPRPMGRAVWDEEVAAGATVRDALIGMLSTGSKLAAVVYGPRAADLTGVANLILNDRLLELMGGLDAVLSDGDRLTVVPAYAGGTEVSE